MPRHKLRQVQSYIEENLRSNLSLHAIAEAAGISASHLKVTFRNATGMPVHQYVIHRRVERAALLLREGKLTISQVAVDVGFAHQSHLAMHMKRLVGVSPSHVFPSAPDSSEGRRHALSPPLKPAIAKAMKCSPSLLVKRLK